MKIHFYGQTLIQNKNKPLNKTTNTKMSVFAPPGGIDIQNKEQRTKNKEQRTKNKEQRNNTALTPEW